ncbi:MAG: succinate--CoA ligase subunit alpha [Acidobacteriota bacterium]|nr:MAG: succinate--CoA ligase subunit alpha [Acidobacteriota bacterium]
MSILVDENSRVVVQGMGAEGSFHALRCKDYGTKVVGGVAPGKGGKKMDGIPLFNTVQEAVEKKNPDVSLLFVPAPFAADALYEAAEAGIPFLVCITEGIPAGDMVQVTSYLDAHGVRLVGPNGPGIISPGKCKIGIMPEHVHKPGPIGVVSRSGTLTYEAVDQLTRLGLGQTTCLGIGGDPVGGVTFVDTLKLFAEDEATEAVVLIGEIGGTAEEDAARYIAKSKFPKPVIAFIAGLTAPPGRRMGHAGAIISGGKGTAKAKIKALESAGVTVVQNSALIGAAVKAVINGKKPPKAVKANFPKANSSKANSPRANSNKANSKKRSRNDR